MGTYRDLTGGGVSTRTAADLVGVPRATATRKPPIPVRAKAAVPANKLDEVLVKNGVANAGTRIAWLGDVIPVRVLHAVISLGDSAIVAGVVLLVVASMSPRPRTAARHVDPAFPTVPV